MTTIILLLSLLTQSASSSEMTEINLGGKRICPDNNYYVEFTPQGSKTESWCEPSSVEAQSDEVKQGLVSKLLSKSRQPKKEDTLLAVPSKLLEGALTGKITKKSPFGVVRLTGYIQKGEYRGALKTFWEFGQKWIDGNWDSKGILHGSYAAYNSNGSLISKGRYVHGKKSGHWTEVKEKGTHSGNYKDDKRDGIWLIKDHQYGCVVGGGRFKDGKLLCDENGGGLSMTTGCPEKLENCK